MARYRPVKLEKLMQDAGIVRNRLKIEASVTNAQAYLAIPDFSAYVWNFVDGRPVQNALRSMSEIPAKTPLAERVSKDLLKRGFRFVGPTIVYAFMQACGLVNDHLTDCHRHEAVKRLARPRPDGARS
jgi:DNA-3-methyladenine glycosylase I